MLSTAVRRFAPRPGVIEVPIAPTPLSADEFVAPDPYFEARNRVTTTPQRRLIARRRHRIGPQRQRRVALRARASRGGTDEAGGAAGRAASLGAGRRWRASTLEYRHLRLCQLRQLAWAKDDQHDDQDDDEMQWPEAPIAAPPPPSTIAFDVVFVPNPPQTSEPSGYFRSAARANSQRAGTCAAATRCAAPPSPRMVATGRTTFERVYGALPAHGVHRRTDRAEYRR
jgi:hypothetical protein